MKTQDSSKTEALNVVTIYDHIRPMLEDLKKERTDNGRAKTGKREASRVSVIRFHDAVVITQFTGTVWVNKEGKVQTYLKKHPCLKYSFRVRHNKLVITRRTRETSKDGKVITKRANITFEEIDFCRDFSSMASRTINDEVRKGLTYLITDWRQKFILETRNLSRIVALVNYPNLEPLINRYLHDHVTLLLRKLTRWERKRLSKGIKAFCKTVCGFANIELTYKMILGRRPEPLEAYKQKETDFKNACPGIESLSAVCSIRNFHQLDLEAYKHYKSLIDPSLAGILGIHASGINDTFRMEKDIASKLKKLKANRISMNIGAWDVLKLVRVFRHSSRIKDISALHDHYMSLQRRILEITAEKHDYTEKIRSLKFPVIHYFEESEYLLKLPGNNVELRELGKKWNNCIGGFGHTMKDSCKKTFVAEVVNSTTGEDVGCIYYRRGKLMQFYGYHNSQIKDQGLYDYFRDFSLNNKARK